MRDRVLRLMISGLCLVLGVSAGTQAAAPLGDAAQVEQLQTSLAKVAEAVAPSVVAVRSERPAGATDAEEGIGSMPDDETHRRFRGPAVGSGVIIDAGGLILTNEHVIHGAGPENITCILSSGEVYTVKAVTSDPRSDLAILRIDARELTSARLGDVSTVRQGHFAIVMGNPFGTAWESQGKPAMSFGIISALGRPLTRQLDPLDKRYYGNLIQTDARINPGNSGGPLLSIRGEVIGITTAVSTRSGGSEGIGYAIPIDKRTKAIIAKLSRGEEIEYGFLGVQLDNPTAEDRQISGGPPTGGALIREVESGTPAAAANLQAGDLVVEFDDARVQDVDQLICAVGAAQVGTPVEVLFYREKKRLTVKVTPARRDVPHGVNIEQPLTWRGMTLADLTPQLREKFSIAENVSGVVILRLEEGRAAQHAGLEPGRVIRQINRDPISTVRQLRKLLPRLNGTVKIILHANPPVELTLPPPSQPGS